MKDLFLKTARLELYKVDTEDFDELCKMLKNPEIMYAWEYNFTDEDVYDWINKCKKFYNEYNLGYFLALDKNSKQVVGQLGLMPDIIDGIKYIEVGYILKKEFWNKGYAIEGVKALVEYAFYILDEDEVIAEIRPMNTPSRKIAQRLGMKVCGSFLKKVHQKEMKHLIYKISKKDFIGS